MSDRYHKEWMEMCRGLPNYQVAKILNRYPTGCDWTGSNKSMMAEAWRPGGEHSVHPDHRDELYNILTNAPRVSPEERRRTKARRDLNARLKRLRYMMSAALEEGEGVDWLAQKIQDLGVSTDEIELLLDGWQSDLRVLGQRADSIRREISYVTQLEMAAAKALRKRKRR